MKMTEVSTLHLGGSATKYLLKRTNLKFPLSTYLWLWRSSICSHNCSNSIGKRKGLRKAVTLIELQVRNAVWTAAHVAFVQDAVSYLQIQYTIDDDVVNYLFDLVEHHGLDQFRGTIGESNARKRYKTWKSRNRQVSQNTTTRLALDTSVQIDRRKGKALQIAFKTRLTSTVARSQPGFPYLSSKRFYFRNA